MSVLIPHALILPEFHDHSSRTFPEKAAMLFQVRGLWDLWWSFCLIFWLLPNVSFIIAYGLGMMARVGLDTGKGPFLAHWNSAKFLRVSLWINICSWSYLLDLPSNRPVSILSCCSSVSAGMSTTVSLLSLSGLAQLALFPSPLPGLWSVWIPAHIICFKKFFIWKPFFRVSPQRLSFPL